MRHSVPHYGGYEHPKFPKGGNLMLKRWRTGFDPATEYFSFRHVWVLLPGLPLNLWNTSALTAIGNLLGHFLKIDEASLHSIDKRLARVLVEVELHAGLMDSIKLEWRGHVMVQRLDYLGLPFRCTTCRLTRHLRKDCRIEHGHFEEEDDMDTGSKDMQYNEECLEEQGLRGGGETVGMEELQDGVTNTLIGKVKTYCPSLFFKLSLWERDYLEKSALLHSVSSVGSEKVVDSSEKGVAFIFVDRTNPQSSNVSIVSKPLGPLEPSSLDLSSQSIPPTIFPVSDPSWPLWLSP
jgi:hypothetical protein